MRFDNKVDAIALSEFTREGKAMQILLMYTFHQRELCVVGLFIIFRIQDEKTGFSQLKGFFFRDKWCLR